jgi:hypothetical protein
MLLDFRDYWGYFRSPEVNRPLAGRNVLVRSVCPQLHGMYTVKLVRACVGKGGGE